MHLAGSFRFRNAPSPGVTASLPIAEHIVEEALAQAGQE